MEFEKKVQTAFQAADGPISVVKNTTVVMGVKPEFELRFMGFHYDFGKRGPRLFRQELNLTNCATWEEADQVVANMVACPILITGAAMSQRKEKMTKMHRAALFPIPPEMVEWVEDDPYAFQIKGMPPA